MAARMPQKTLPANMRTPGSSSGPDSALSPSSFSTGEDLTVHHMDSETENGSTLDKDQATSSPLTSGSDLSSEELHSSAAEEDDEELSTSRSSLPVSTTASAATSVTRTPAARVRLKTTLSTPVATTPAHGGTRITSAFKTATASSSKAKTSSSQIPPPTSEVELERLIFRRIRLEGQSEIEEFFIKFKNRSYGHCEWVGRDWIEYNDKRGKQRIKHFCEKTMYDISYSLLTEDRPFNEAFLKIDRILDEMDYRDPFGKETLHWYLVKWCSLSYDQATWEASNSLKAEYEDEDELLLKIKEFRYRSLLPHLRNPTYYQKCLPPGIRTPAQMWRKLEEAKGETEFKDGNTLRPYQTEGLNWLLYCWYHRQSCVLGDEMGLGKTVQSVTFLERLYSHEGVRGPFLIVAPLSTVPHWERTVNSWTNLNCVVFHGSAASRNILQHYEFYYRDVNGRKINVIAPPNMLNKSHAVLKQAFNQYKFDVMITTYEMAIAGASILKNVPMWRVVIVDEAHRLKNKGSKVGEILKSFNLEHRVLLTGTPIQNSLEELWSILNFMDPVRFPDNGEKSFLTEFNLKSADDVQRLQALLKPLMLRRLKEDVEKSIPVKEETIIEVELTKIQRAYYRAILERNFMFLKQGTKKSNVPNLINTMMELRKCCIHPYLIKGAEDKVLADAQATTPEAYFDCLVQASGKLVLLDKLLPKLKEGGHRVLMFSQMTKCLDLLGEYLRLRGYAYERIDGGIRGDARQAAIDRFSAPDSESFVFLLCTRAGGVGINLTAADTCIIFDSDWNPQNDLQAQARCHRIGQKKNVKIYRLITRNTYEKTMFERAGMKLGLDKAVLSRIEDSSAVVSDPGEFGQGGLSSLSKQEIDSLLKKGAYAALMADSEEVQDDETKRFCDEDIDQILERRTQIIRHGPEEEKEENSQPETVTEKPQDGSLFSKATFSLGEETTTEHDLEDPLFWDKWAKKANLDPTVLLEEQSLERNLIVEEPRRRKKVDRFNLVEEGLLDSEIGPDDENDRRKSSKRGGPNTWSLAERGRLERGLMVYGFGAWEKKLNSHPRRSINDVKAAELAMLQWCADKMKETIESRRSTKPAKKAKPPAKNSSKASTPVQEEDLKGKKAGPSREENRILREDERLVEDIEAMLRMNQWTVPTLEDIDKMAEHGCAESFKGHDEKREEDPELGPIPYPGASRERIVAYKSLLAEAPAEYLDALNKKKRNLLLRVQMMHFIRQFMIAIDMHTAGDIWIRKPAEVVEEGQQSSESTIVDKYAVLFRSMQEKHRFPPIYFQPSPYYSAHPGSTASNNMIPSASVGSFNFDWWKAEEDRDLLLGTLKWGYQSYDQIRADPNLVFSQVSWTISPIGTGNETKPADEATAQPEVESIEQTPHTDPMEEDTSKPAIENDLRPWPNGSELGCRLRRLISLYQRQMREEEGGVRSSSSLVTDGEGGYYVEQDHRWSKRDRTEFYKTANFWGIPEEEISEANHLDAKRRHWHILRTKEENDSVVVVRRDWTMFRALCGLPQKSDFSMEVFLQAFMKRCLEIVSEKGSDFVPEYFAGGIPLWRPLTVGEKSDIGPGFSIPCNIEPKDWTGNLVDPCEGITFERAAKMLRRVSLFHTLRVEVLKNPSLMDKLSEARSPAGLPDWWRGANCDASFIRGISKYGTDASMQLSIMADKELCFRERIESLLNSVGLELSLDEVVLKKKALSQQKKDPKTTSTSEEDFYDVINSEDILSGDVILEDVVGWPVEIIRYRRLVYLVDLVLGPIGQDTSFSNLHGKRKIESSPTQAVKKIKEMDMDQ